MTAMLCILGGCASHVGPERSLDLETGAIQSTDTPSNIVAWDNETILMDYANGDPTSLFNTPDGLQLVTEGIGTAIGFNPNGSVFLWSPKDVDIASAGVERDAEGRIIGVTLDGLSSIASAPRDARVALAAELATSINELAESERAAVEDLFTTISESASAMAPLASQVLTLLGGG
ncbi:MAG: hypothetical protein AAGI17_01900 [Planctomycetota bacterium]